jgi:hypothetical protein
VPNGNGGFSSAYKTKKTSTVRITGAHQLRCSNLELKHAYFHHRIFALPGWRNRLRAEAPTTGPSSSRTAALKLRQEHFVIDGEAVVLRADGISVPVIEQNNLAVRELKRIVMNVRGFFVAHVVARNLPKPSLCGSERLTTLPRGRACDPHGGIPKLVP